MTHRLPIEDDASVIVARTLARDLALRAGLGEEVAGAAAIATSELGYNQLRHARLGELAFHELARGGRPGLEVVASDSGRGLVDPALAFRGVSRTHSPGLGIGLAGVRRLAHELDVHSRAAEGLTLWARFFPPDTPKNPEYVIVGQPHPDETRSGDDAVVIRSGDRLVIALADGLGHGREAREASSAACRCCTVHAHLEPVDVLRACEDALRTTRGTALAVASLNLGTDEIAVAVAGNIRVGLYDAEGGRRFAYTPHVLGAGRRPRLRQEQARREGRTLVLFTDGLPERVDPSTDRPGVIGWPLGLAARMLARHARENDDATVIAVR